MEKFKEENEEINELNTSQKIENNNQEKLEINEDELIESKTNFSRKPNLDFGKKTLNTNKINNNDFSHLLTNNEISDLKRFNTEKEFELNKKVYPIKKKMRIICLVNY